MTEKGLPHRRFIVDVMLGKTAKWLRAMGFDAILLRLESPNQVEALASEGYVVLTRSPRWSERPRVICLGSNDPMEQLREVFSRAPISVSDICFLSRCTLCNLPLEPFARDLAFGLVPDFVFETNTAFHRCPNCQRVYWPGSHSKRMMERLQSVLGLTLSADDKQEEG